MRGAGTLERWIESKIIVIIIVIVIVIIIVIVRMDGAWLGSVDIAIKKAKTATFFQMNTEDIGGLSQPGGSLFNIEHSNNGLITFPGGIPLRYSTVYYSTVQYSTVQYSTVQYSTVQYYFSGPALAR